jgi:hypothetical protein
MGIVYRLHSVIWFGCVIIVVIYIRWLIVVHLMVGSDLGFDCGLLNPAIACRLFLLLR